MIESLVRAAHAPRLRLLALTGALLALVTGCASTNLADLWRDPDFSGPPMRNVFVIAMKRNRVQRRLWEDGFAAELSKRGVRVTPSYRLFPGAPPDTDRVEQTVRENDFDGVLIVRQLPTEIQRNYVPGYTSVYPVTYRHRWSGAYDTYFRQYYTPGYVERQKVVRYQVEMWSARDDGQIVWAGTSESIDPSSAVAVGREVGRLIVPELVKQRIIAAAR